MNAFKVTINGNDQNKRFATSAEAQMLADTLADDFPDAEISIIEIEQFTNYTINEHGLNEIKEFLADNHKKGGDHFDRDMLLAWAADAEFQLSEGNPASIEIKSFDSIHGRTQEFTISDAGLDSEIIEIEQ